MKEPLKLLPAHTPTNQELRQKYSYLYDVIWSRLGVLLAEERDNQHKPSKTRVSDGTESIQT
jgi:hypothetical protein